MPNYAFQPTVLALRARPAAERGRLCGNTMSANGYRNTTWNDSIEQAFEAKLRRARSKEQYLRIQACALARSHPKVALELLNRYFELPDDFDRAQAHVDRATALVALGCVEDAIASYEEALTREVLFPKLQTQAYLPRYARRPPLNASV